MSGTRHSPPISSHPAFSTAVAAWFAALFGLSLFVIPGAALESLVSATGISSLVAAAEPPLDMTDRLVTSMVGALLGAAIGLIVARRFVTASHSALSEIEPVETETIPYFAAQDPVMIDAERHEAAIFRETAEDSEDSEGSPGGTEEESGEIVHNNAVSNEPPEPEPEARSIADRLTSRVRASESGEPSVSADVAAMAAAAAARESEGLSHEPKRKTFEDAADGNDVARSADVLLAKMPQINHADAARDAAMRVAPPTLKPDLDQMLSRLEQNMVGFDATGDAENALPSIGSVADSDGNPEPEGDPVVALLREEADRAGSAPQSASRPQDPDDSQDRLRQALDRLTQVSDRT